jgi:hypothetical protein
MLFFDERSQQTLQQKVSLYAKLFHYMLMNSLVIMNET